jgi:hypothetical protein
MTSSVLRRPERSEAADYYFTYIDQIQAADVVNVLAHQRDEFLTALRGVPEDRAAHRYADGKWTLAEAIGHVNDTERVFCSRALWFARGFESPLPSFDQNVAVANGHFETRSLASLTDEFAAIRDGSLALFRSLAPGDWDKRGIASDKPFTVRAMAFITAGHVAHHLEILKTRYLA